jgi:hypothetical protein
VVEVGTVAGEAAEPGPVVAGPGIASALGTPVGVMEQFHGEALLVGPSEEIGVPETQGEA